MKIEDCVEKCSHYYDLGSKFHFNQCDIYGCLDCFWDDEEDFDCDMFAMKEDGE